MNIDDEPLIWFINDNGINACYTIKELVAGRRTCSDEQYSTRIDICKSCNSCVGNELCTEDGQLVRVSCRLQYSSCPLKKW